MTKPLHSRKIATLGSADRIAILDAIAKRDHLVAVEYDSRRDMETAKTLVGRIIGVAYAPTAPCSTELLIQPLDSTKRIVAMSAAIVLRVSMARPDGAVGEVLAGPPRS